jgi:hypothetical protein
LLTNVLKDQKIKSISTLMPDVELLILSQVELDGSDPARTSYIVTQLEDWRETINLIGKNRTSAENPKDDICKSLSKAEERRDESHDRVNEAV